MNTNNIVFGVRTNGEEFYDVYAHYAFCDNLSLQELTVEGSAESVYCDYNELTKLEYPDGVETLWCDHNKLTELRIADSLKTLICDKELFDYDTIQTIDVAIMYTDEFKRDTF